jgi:hypothetical protein
LSEEGAAGNVALIASKALAVIEIVTIRGFQITLPHNIIGRVKALRCPGESYCDIIVRIAATW